MPTPGEFCLDTNIAVAFLNGNPSVVERIRLAQRVALPLPVIGELLYGAKKSGLKESNLLRFREFIRACDCIEPSTQAAETYSDFKLHPKKAGTPIPENDIWIAAIADVAGLTLVTDDKHFNNLPGLQMENWLTRDS